MCISWINKKCLDTVDARANMKTKYMSLNASRKSNYVYKFSRRLHTLKHIYYAGKNIGRNHRIFSFRIAEMNIKAF